MILNCNPVIIIIASQLQYFNLEGCSVGSPKMD